MTRLFSHPRASSAFTVSLLSLFFLACAPSEETETAEQAPPPSPITCCTIEDGIYAVLWEAAVDSATVGDYQLVLPYERKYTGSSEPEPTTYLCLDTSTWVPMILEGEPQADKDDTGRTLLSVTLAQEHAKELEEFTEKHFGGRAAVILEREVVTMHKIKSIIREGKLQITRCGDNGCEVLLSRLAK